MCLRPCCGRRASSRTHPKGALRVGEGVPPIHSAQVGVELACCASLGQLPHRVTKMRGEQVGLECLHAGCCKRQSSQPHEADTCHNTLGHTLLVVRTVLHQLFDRLAEKGHQAAPPRSATAHTHQASARTPLPVVGTVAAGSVEMVLHNSELCADLFQVGTLAVGAVETTPFYGGGDGQRVVPLAAAVSVRHHRTAHTRRHWCVQSLLLQHSHFSARKIAQHVGHGWRFAIGRSAAARHAVWGCVLSPATACRCLLSGYSVPVSSLRLQRTGVFSPATAGLYTVILFRRGIYNRSLHHNGVARRTTAPCLSPPK